MFWGCVFGRLWCGGFGVVVVLALVVLVVACFGVFLVFVLVVVVCFVGCF